MQDIPLVASKEQFHSAVIVVGCIAAAVLVLGLSLLWRQ